MGVRDLLKHEEPLLYEANFYAAEKGRRSVVGGLCLLHLLAYHDAQSILVDSTLKPLSPEFLQLV